MFGTEHLALFTVSGLLLNLTPGQDTLYIVGRSVSQGRRAGMFSVMGIVSGSIIHTFLAAFGFSAILAVSSSVHDREDFRVGVFGVSRAKAAP